MKVVATVIPAISALMVIASAIAEDPSGFPSDAEIKKIPKEQIIATIKHQHQLLVDTQKENEELRELLKHASTSQSIALTAAGGALSKLSDLEKHDRQMTEALNKANKALNWYRWHWWGSWIVLGLGVLACGVLAFLKFTGRLAIAGAKIAS